MYADLRRTVDRERMVNIKYVVIVNKRDVVNLAELAEDALDSWFARVQ